MSPRYRLVIFDFDGTLADSGDWFLSIADHLAERFKFRKVPADEVESLRGKTSSEVIRHLGIPRWKLPAIGRYTHDLLAQQTDRIALFGGVTRLLEQLAASGVRIALVTSNAEDNARAILGPANAALIERFECGASLFGKARRYRKVLRKCNVALHEAISIGDETRDVVAAKKVGICSGAVLWGYANRAVLERLEPDLLFETPGEVLEYLLGGQATLAA